MIHFSSSVSFFLWYFLYLLDLYWYKLVFCCCHIWICFSFTHRTQDLDKVTRISTTNDFINSFLLLFSRWNIYQFISYHHIGITDTKQVGLSSMNDQEIIYADNIIAISSRQEMRIKKNIGQVVLVDWSNTKFFKIPSFMADSKENYLRDLGSERENATARSLQQFSQFISLLRLAEALP